MDIHGNEAAHRKGWVVMVRRVGRGLHIINIRLYTSEKERERLI